MQGLALSLRTKVFERTQAMYPTAMGVAGSLASASGFQRLRQGHQPSLMESP